MSWWEYVQRVAQTSRQRDVTDRSGVDPSHVSRWKSGHVPKPDLVAQFARAYGRPVIEAFVAAGFLTSEEAKVRPNAAPDFTQLSNDELLALVAGRMREDVGQDAASITEAPTGATKAKSTRAHSAKQALGQRHGRD